MAPALGLESETLKVLLPVNGAALLIATENVLAAASPSAHLSVPLVAVKSVHVTAVPFLVE